MGADLIERRRRDDILLLESCWKHYLKLTQTQRNRISFLLDALRRSHSGETLASPIRKYLGRLSVLLASGLDPSALQAEREAMRREAERARWQREADDHRRRMAEWDAARPPVSRCSGCGAASPMWLCRPCRDELLGDD